MAKDTGVLDILINTTHRHVWLRKYESLGLGWKGVIPFLNQYLTFLVGEEVVTFLNQYLTTGISYITTTHMNAWLRKYESTGFGWGKCHSLSQPYKHIIPRIWGYVNPLYDIFFI